MNSPQDPNRAYGLKSLNDYFRDNAYINGDEPTQADVSVYETVITAPDYCHLLRWFKSMSALDHASLPEGKKSDAPQVEAKSDAESLGSEDEEEDPELVKQRAERVAAYNAKKATKPAAIAKSSVILDVKPWDDTTDMEEMERLVREISMEGLLWGASKLVPVGYGIENLRISVVVEDEKVSMDELEEQICALEDHVQCVDIVSFNKI